MATLNEIYQKYALDVYRFALGLCGDPAWADDLTSETFVRALVSPKPIRTETVKAYLFTITRNLYLQAWHKAKRQTSLDEMLPDSHPGPEHLAAQQDEYRTILAALQTLSEPDRTALLMRVRDELPYEDIATALGLSLAAVKVKVHRARLKMAAFARRDEVIK
ncbi:MAG: sigma-70 family RNA polymerase sigma factor [Anaerolineales bacterium]|nr:sigma-70 family RNA polymerase sigma factor [Anaerolineales bacterium]